MNIPLPFSPLALEALHLHQILYLHLHRPHPHTHTHTNTHQPLTTPISSSSAEGSSSFPIPYRRVNLCHTRRPQRQLSSQASQLPSQVPSINKVRVRAEGEGEESLFIIIIYFLDRPFRVSPIASPAVEAAIPNSYFKRLRTQTNDLRTRHRPP